MKWGKVLLNIEHMSRIPPYSLGWVLNTKTAFTSPFGKYEYNKVLFRLLQATAYLQELMTGILKDDIIIFSRTAEEHLSHIKQVFKKLQNAHLSMKLSKCQFFTKDIQYLGHILSTKGTRLLPSKTQVINNMYQTKTAKQHCLDDKAIDTLYFHWTPVHHTVFLMLKEAVTQVPILCYPVQIKWYIVYTDAPDNACGAQLSQEHNGTEFPIAFLSHTFIDTQRKLITTKHEAYRVYYAVTKWNYYLQRAEVIICNDHKPLARFLNGKKCQ